jgi:hypothetical protein
LGPPIASFPNLVAVAEVYCNLVNTAGMKNKKWFGNRSWIDTRDTDGMSKLNSETQRFERCVFEIFTAPLLGRVLVALKRKSERKKGSPRLHGAAAVDASTDSRNDIQVVQ